MLTVNCIEKTKIKKKGAVNGTLKIILSAAARSKTISGSVTRFGEISSPLSQHFNSLWDMFWFGYLQTFAPTLAIFMLPTGQIFNDVNGQRVKNIIAIWLHCSWMHATFLKPKWEVTLPASLQLDFKPLVFLKLFTLPPLLPLYQLPSVVNAIAFSDSPVANLIAPLRFIKHVCRI